jgi:hypothetical protein
MKVKIISDGTPRGTRVVDTATGEPLYQVRAVTWACEARGTAKAILELVGVEIEVIGEAEIKR